MRKKWLALLALGAASCGKQLDVASDVALKHQNGAAVQRQIELLQAQQVKVSATAATAGAAGPVVLNLEVINPYDLAAQPDTLKQRMRKLARLLVADLASPGSYQVVTAQATFSRSFLSKHDNSSSQAFIYPIASLR
ncbi:MAG: hypothetical protein EOO40_02105 [Deltaproteobacteria bacterium]|nr:MAG: hypothetical protein EOO40_02105 [Deltaproteobacteria bacterium]